VSSDGDLNSGIQKISNQLVVDGSNGGIIVIDNITVTAA